MSVPLTFPTYSSCLFVFSFVLEYFFNSSVPVFDFYPFVFMLYSRVATVCLLGCFDAGVKRKCWLSFK